MTPRTRFILASGLAAATLVFLAYRAGVQTHGSREVADSRAPEDEARLLSFGKTLTLNWPLTREALPGTLNAARDAFSASASNSKVPESTDLIAAWQSHLEAVVTGDYERRTSALAARGFTEDYEDEEVRQAAKRNFELLAAKAYGRKIGLPAVVRIIWRDGRAAAPSALEEGYATLTMDPPATAIQQALTDTDIDGLVVELRCAMEASPQEGTAAVPALLGLQFAWSRSRRAWVPIRTVIYTPANTPIQGFPL